MKFWLKFVLLLGLAVSSSAVMAADLAILSNGNSIRHEHRRVMGSVTRLYLGADEESFIDVPTKDIEHFEKDMSPPSVAAAVSLPHTPPNLPSPAALPSHPAVPSNISRKARVSAQPMSSQDLSDVVSNSSDRYHLDPDLVNSVIHAESGFNQHARSPKGAQGLMQLMPGTASKLGVSNAYDPQANIEGGTKYLRELLELYNFDLVKALAAYNAGPQRVQQYHGVPPYYETQAYIARIIKDFNRKKLAERKAASAVAAKTTPKKATLAAQTSKHEPAVKVAQNAPH